jgi:predicted secreted protein/stringent starvation protein B
LDFSDLDNIKFIPSTSVAKYDITLADESTAHGTVAITVGGTVATTAKKDDIVTISVTPNSGYSTKDVTVRAYTSWGGASTRGFRAPALQDEIDVTAGQTAGTWTFTMPGANVWVVVAYAKNLQDSWIQAIATQYYTGSAIEPTVIVKDGNTTLTKGTDYTVTYENNVEVGTANVIVTAVSGSNYSGTANATFIIERAENKLLSELYEAIGTDVWTGYGEQTGVISYSRGDDPKEFRATFMGGLSTIDLPFDAFTSASKVDNGDGSYTYTLVVNLPAQTGMSQETLHVTMKNGEITGMESENAGLDMSKENSGIDSWTALQNALTNGGVIKLTQTITAASTDAALVVPAGKTVVLELNGQTINRALTSAIANGSVIINNGILAITDTEGGKIIGGNTTGNGGGILNNGTLTLYGGEITGNKAAGQGGGVYNTVTNTATTGFWMTGGLIDNNTASNYAAIGGDVTFNNLVVVQVNADGTTFSAKTAKANMAEYSYIKPVMPDPAKYAILTELYEALGNDVWTGYGTLTGVISYSRGNEPNEFRAVFMGGTYTIDVPFGDVTFASKVDNGDGSFTYTLKLALPAQTGMSSETVHVTVKNGEITEMDSENAGIEMNKEEGPISGWSALQNAMSNGGVVKLAADVIAESTDAALTVPEGKTVILELNGHTINRALTSAVANGSVIINNGILAIMDTEGGKIIGGKTTGNGGGILNNGTLTLYGGEITGNKATGQGGGVYNTITNTATTGFWMTGGLIDGNTAESYPAIGGDVTFNNLAVVQIDADGAIVSAKTAKANMAEYNFVKPVMPDPEKFAILSELYEALGDDVWTGYGTKSGVISYSRADEPNEFRATFMGGTYSIDVPFGDVISAEKVDNGDGSYTYNLVVSLPALTGMTSETLHVTMKNGEITEMESENAGIEMNKEEGPVSGWTGLQNALNNGGVVKLAADVIAESTDAALTVPEGKTVVLELNGFTINRNLAEAAANGSVIINNGTLAITGDGIITGGNTTGNGGGILNNGTLTLYDGEITSNTAAGQGGGVYNTVTNTDVEGFWMTGGLIDGNTAESYPAIGGDVTFNSMAAIQINAEGAKVSIAKAKAGMETYSYIKPVMPDPENYYVVAATLTIPANSYASYISDKGLELAMGTVNGVVLTSVKNVDAVAGTVTLFDALESAAAQTPLIIYNGTDEDQMVDLIVNENGAEVSYDAEHFFGTLEPKTFTPDDMAEADHYVLDGQNFTWVKDAGTLPANRCWLKVIPSSPNHARTMDIIFESDATDISSVNTNTATNNGPIYDLTGRKLSKKPTRGYYIQGGKKYVVK